MELISEQKLRVPLKSWLPRHEIEHAAMAQLRLAARHPAVTPHIAVMPDCHPGERVTIGCVLPANGGVIPAAVGSDIGCGMAAVNTGQIYDPKDLDQHFWMSWEQEVRARVPVGFAGHEGRLSPDWDGFDEESTELVVAQRILEHAPRTLGTLGGGNHFMEALVDTSQRLWLMVHSGSRIAGTIIHDHYDRLARHANQRRGTYAPGRLWWLRTDCDAGRAYMRDMEWATRFARENRRRMLLHMLEALSLRLKDVGGAEALQDCEHNFARVERHFGRELVVHRKGATSAARDEVAFIPGSMGSASYVVSGCGQPDSLRSCSHGAGRRLSRSAARSEVDVDDLEIALYLAGTHTAAGASLISEAPQAYKSIDEVMERQRDLVHVLHRLQPLMTIKA